MLISRDDQVPRPKDVLWIENPAANEQQNFLIYSQHFQGLWSHWNGKRSTPCYHEHARCFKGHNGESLRWYGYLHAFSYKKNKPVFLQVPAGSAYAFKEQFAAGFQFRGLHVTVTRKGSKQSPLVFLVNAHQGRDPHSLPPVRDCLKSVLHTWKVYEIESAVNNALCRELSDIPLEEAA